MLKKPSSQFCWRLVHCWKNQASKHSHGCLPIPLLAHPSFPVCHRHGHVYSSKDGKKQLRGEDRREKWAPVPPEAQPRTTPQIMPSLSITNHSQLTPVIFSLPLLWCKLEEKNEMEYENERRLFLPRSHYLCWKKWAIMAVRNKISEECSLQAEKATTEGKRALICAFQPTAFKFTTGLYLTVINLGLFLVYSVICALHFTELDFYFPLPFFYLSFVCQCYRWSHLQVCFIYISQLQSGLSTILLLCDKWYLLQLHMNSFFSVCFISLQSWLVWNNKLLSCAWKLLVWA